MSTDADVVTGDIDLKEPKRIVSVEPEVCGSGERFSICIHSLTQPIPQVTVHELGGSDGANCCIVLACDGIFDVMSDEEAVSVLTLYVLHSCDTDIDIALTLSCCDMKRLFSDVVDCSHQVVPALVSYWICGHAFRISLFVARRACWWRDTLRKVVGSAKERAR